MDKEFIENDKTLYKGPMHESVVCFDVDDTLILWGRREDYDFQMRCPYSGTIEGAQVHKEHVERVKRHYRDGHFVIVWSGGGAPHAKEVVERLHLSDYVHLILEKPMQYYDDLDASIFMPKRTYIPLGHNVQIHYTQLYSDRIK